MSIVNERKRTVAFFFLKISSQKIQNIGLMYTYKITLLYLKWITNKDPLYSTQNSAQCYVAASMGGEFGREQMHVYVWLNPFTVHLKLSQHC